ncbi:hypothetical protein ALC62_00074, partial [Cyphomyrmex costatus]
IHSQLYRRKRQPAESNRRYIYAMQEIAEQGHIEEDALIQYIIDGIQDEECNKTLLYNAETIRELKKCFEVYDRIKEKGQQRKTTTKKDSAKDNTKDTAKGQTKASAQPAGKKHCFNCGSTEHDVKSCTNADKGPKCFKCNEYGHIASKCSKSQPEATMTTVNCISANDKFVLINVAESTYGALIDTTSDVSLMRHDMYEKIGRPELSDTTRLFTGLGNVSIKPMGTFRLRFSIQENVYEIQAYVVPMHSMTTKLILGLDFLEDTEVTIKKGRIEVKRFVTEDAITPKQVKADINKNDQPDGFKELSTINYVATEEIEVAEPY